MKQEKSLLKEDLGRILKNIVDIAMKQVTSEWIAQVYYLEILQLPQ